MQPEELREYTVKIKAEGKSGTGFFVAPGLILTCAHVVTEGDERKPIEAIKAYWQNIEYTAFVAQLPVDLNVDLALLQLEQSRSNNLCVFLDESINNGDSLYSFGYTDDYPNGDPRNFIYTDLTGDNPPLMTFGNEQVQPGFSGAPLLNQRTGKVCGLIKRSRDIYKNLGGRGVSVAVVFENFPELKPKTIPNNPFFPLSGKINNSRLVFGREREIKEIFELLNSGSSVALIGDRGSGKSSLLQAVYDLAETKLNPSRQPIYLNMGNIYDEEDFYWALCNEIGIATEEDNVLKGNRFYRKVKKHRLLLILDEVEKMVWDGFTNQVRSQIRALANDGNNSPFRLVVAAPTSLTQAFADSGLDSPFENICIEQVLNPWTEEITQAFINNKLQQNTLSFTPSEISRIFTETQGYPLRIMNACHQLYRSKCHE